jgi:hypothetical protein
MTADELAQLADELTDWYYAEHGGMLLTPASQAMFVHLRANLTGGSFRPASWKNLVRDASADDDRWLLLWRQASLLRTQLKVDCGVYFPGGVSTGPAFRPYDADFLGPAAGAKEWQEAFARGGAPDGVAYLKVLRSERITAAGGSAG